MWLLHNETFQAIVLLELFTDDPNKIVKTYDGITYREGNTYDESQEFIQKLRNLKPRN